MRSVQDFVAANGWTVPALNPKEFAAIQKQVTANLVYYQTNYGAVAISFLLLVAYESAFYFVQYRYSSLLHFSFFQPTAIIFGLLVVAALLAGFVYSSRQKAAFTASLQDRPLAILLLLLASAFLVIRMFGTVFVFLLGIALPLVCKFSLKARNWPCKVLFSDCGACCCPHLEPAEQGRECRR